MEGLLLVHLAEGEQVNDDQMVQIVQFLHSLGLHPNQLCNCTESPLGDYIRAFPLPQGIIIDREGHGDRNY
jgi:hypothetical protein